MRGDRIHVPYLMDHCPFSASTYFKVIRLVNGAFSIRRVEQDTEVSGKIPEAGNSIMVFIRELQQNRIV
jgi:hypothetical protein